VSSKETVAIGTRYRGLARDRVRDGVVGERDERERRQRELSAAPKQNHLLKKAEADDRQRLGEDRRCRPRDIEVIQVVERRRKLSTFPGQYEQNQRANTYAERVLDNDPPTATGA